jgi:integrase
VLTGSVRKRGSTWTAYRFLPVPDGRRRQVSKGGFKTKKTAQEHLTGVMHALQTSSYVLPARQTLAEYFDQWHAAAASRLRPKTVDSYRQVFNRYLRSTLGDTRLQSLTAVDLDSLYAALLRAGGKGGNPLSPTTVIHVHAVMSKLLSDALRKGVVVRNVAQAASPPRQLRPAERHLTVWSGEQLKAFLASVENERLYALRRLYAVSGCRRGEALAVTWDDIDLERGRWEIRRSLVTIGSAVVLGPPKSGRGRVVALDQVTIATLRTHRARQNEERLAWGPAYEDGNRVFCRENGTHLHPNDITHAFARLLTRAGLPKIRLHDGRHSAVTAMLRSGIPVKVVAERVGHASTSFTQDVYASVLPDMQRDAAERLAAAIDGV